MEKPLSVFIGTNNHVPYGAEDSEFEFVYRNRLKPFIVALNNFSKIKAALHYSGVLLHWIEKAHPEFFMLIGDLLSRRQVELVGGGFYEPMLPLIPPQDRIGQIEMLTTYIRKQFGKRPLGCWLPAAAWDQSLVGVLNTCGMGFTFLREQQFLHAGLSGEGLYAPCITEDQGKLLMVFPVLNRLTRETDSVTRLLEQKAGEISPGGERLIVLCPDCFFQNTPGAAGDAGGVIPGLAGERKINRFFEELSACESMVDFTTPARIYKTRRPVNKAYFPASSELDAVVERGTGAPLLSKHFLIHYPEANGIYAKMTYTHLLINQLRGDKARKQSAQEELWKGQGYDTFCRGIGGGIFRNTVRNTAYRALLEAEKTTRKKGVFIPSLMTFDFDLDGEDEYLFQVEHINCYVKPRGASVFEFDFLPRSWNYLDTFSAASVSGAVSPGRRGAFVDILAPPGIPPLELVEAGFSAAGAAETGAAGKMPGGEERKGIRYCGGEFWETGEIDKTKKKAAFLLVPRAAGAFAAIAIKKEYHLKKDSLTVRYTLTNKGENHEEFNFIPRIDLAFSGEGELCQRIYRLGAPAGNAGPESAAGGSPVSREPIPLDAVFISGLAAVEFQDLKNEVILTLLADQNFDVAISPVTSSCPVYGEERSLYQSTCVLPVKPLSLAPGASYSAEFTLKLSH
jgi:hypothetical protein